MTALVAMHVRAACRSPGGAQEGGIVGFAGELDVGVAICVPVQAFSTGGLRLCLRPPCCGSAR